MMGGRHATCAYWVDYTQVHIRSAMVTMYLLGVNNDVIIEHIKATCSCDCVLGHRANTYLKAPRRRTQNA